VGRREASTAARGATSRATQSAPGALRYPAHLHALHTELLVRAGVCAGVLTRRACTSKLRCTTIASNGIAFFTLFRNARARRPSGTHAILDRRRKRARTADYTFRRAFSSQIGNSISLGRVIPAPPALIAARASRLPPS